MNRQYFFADKINLLANDTQTAPFVLNQAGKLAAQFCYLQTTDIENATETSNTAFLNI